MEIGRVYFSCAACALGECAADARLGLEDGYTRAARELICLSGANAGFERGADHLQKYCGWTVSPQTLRRRCEAEGVKIAAWRLDGGAPHVPADAAVGAGSAALPEAIDLTASTAFAAAPGVVEFFTDGTSVNTLAGWKEIRLALWQKRPPGNAALPWEYPTRVLPRATARSVLVELLPAEEFGALWRPQTSALGIADTTTLAIYADGAEWIWNQAAVQFPGAAQTLDIMHALHHFADAIKTVHGTTPGAVEAWLAIATHDLLSAGWNGACRWVAKFRDQAGHTPEVIAASEPLLNYLGKHAGRLDYAALLAAGKSIGSGPVEGAAKQIVGKRLKQTGARWTEANAVRMATLCSLQYADDWDDYWKPAINASTPTLAA